MGRKSGNWRNDKYSDDNSRENRRALKAERKAGKEIQEVLTPSKLAYAAPVTPRTKNQMVYNDLLFSRSNDIVFGIGPAGTGKSLLAAQAAVQMLVAKDVSTIIIVRPAVGVEGEKHGFLPGDLDQKLDPWVRPLMRCLAKVYNKFEIEKLKKLGVIEISALAYMRGETFDNAVILLDEAQNTSIGQLKMLLTRIGENSKIFINGDIDQQDSKNKESGLVDFVERLKARPHDRIQIVQFGKEDIQRNPIIDDILRLYNE